MDVQTMNEKQMLRKIRAKRRFKAFVRQVIRNLYWLMDFDDIKLGDDVKQNVTLIYSKKKSKPGLSLETKCLLRKNAAWRTDAEKNILYKSIGDLKCFRKWPDEVKYKLVSSTYFVYFEAGRTIVKENRFAHALYVVITGEVAIFQEVYDEILGTWVTQQLGRRGAGNIFGEVSFLKKIPRTATIVTLTPCELIYVDREDFDDTLHEILKEQWDEIKAGLATFPYFEGLSENSQTECCMLSKMQQYEPNEIIYGNKNKASGCAYFILQGSCKVLELINIEEKMVKGKTILRLYNIEKSWHAHHNLSSLSIASKSFISQNSSIDTSFTSSTVHIDLRKKEIKQEIYEKCPNIKGLLRNFGNTVRYANRIHDKSHSKALTLPKNVTSVFLEICKFNEKTCFFENDILENRRVVSDGHVKCLLIPVYWLQMHNKANIWNRLVVFMKDHIPNTQGAFAKYLAKRKWVKYRNIIKHEVLSKHTYPNDTAWFDIPYSLRMADRF